VPHPRRVGPLYMEPRHLLAKTYNSGFKLAHDTYNGMGTGSDGKIYYVLSSEKFDTGAQVYSFDPAAEKIQHLGDLTEACGEKDKKTIVQGKSHVTFVECKGKLYFATHTGFYAIIDDMEKMGPPPAGSGYKPYPGGHFVAYDMASGKFESLAIEPRGEGILTMNMDTKRGRLYGLTWPTAFSSTTISPQEKQRTLGRLHSRAKMAKGKRIVQSAAPSPLIPTMDRSTSPPATARFAGIAMTGTRSRPWKART